MNTALFRWLLCVSLLAFIGAAGAETVFTAAPHGQHWIKRGIVAAPGFAGPQSSAFVSAPSVIRLANGRLRMYVWVADGLHIGGARSRDGIQWDEFDDPILRARVSAADPYEACLARPAVIKLDGVYHMWLGVYDMAKGNRPSADQSGPDRSPEALNRDAAAGSYRIEYARSIDGIHWTRFADQPISPLTPGGFDSTSQTYASVVDMGEELWLFYAGDGLGTTGVGLSTLDKNELRAN